GGAGGSQGKAGAAAAGEPFVRGVSRAIALAVLLVATGAPAAPAADVSDDAVRHVASQLRCVVCQNLSVADSPSEMARQMREVIRERLGQGETDEQGMHYFEERD